VAIRSGENFSAKHFSVIAFIKKLVTLTSSAALPDFSCRFSGIPFLSPMPLGWGGQD
jgi:hypothetical protein